MLNIPTLSTLVRWAAEEEVRNSDPSRAVELGVSKKTDPRLGRHDQNQWAGAERNGVCKTAFCIAGGAVTLEKEWVIVMRPMASARYHMSEHVIRRTSIPRALQGEVQWDMLWVNMEEYRNLMDRGLLVTIENKAEEVLGLTPSQAFHLFDGDNDASKVVSLAMQFARQAGVTLNLPVWVIEEFEDPSVIHEYLDDAGERASA